MAVHCFCHEKGDKAAFSDRSSAERGLLRMVTKVANHKALRATFHVHASKSIIREETHEKGPHYFLFLR